METGGVAQDEPALPEVRLHSNAEERVTHDNLSELYSIIKTVEHLERAYIRDAVTPEAYAQACRKLIGQFRTLRDALGDHVPSVEGFMGEMRMAGTCKHAANRLIASGVPATVEHDSGAGGGGGGNEDALGVFHCVQHFITAMDSLKLEMRAVDELHPHLSDLMESLAKVGDLPPDHVAKENVGRWLRSLNTMRATDELSDEQVRQMSFDLEQAYNAFHKHLQDK